MIFRRCALGLLLALLLFSSGCISLYQKTTSMKFEPNPDSLILSRESIFILETTDGEPYEIQWQPEYPRLTEFYFYGYYLEEDNHLHDIQIPRENIQSIQVKEYSPMMRMMLSGSLTVGIFYGVIKLIYAGKESTEVVE